MQKSTRVQLKQPEVLNAVLLWLRHQGDPHLLSHHMAVYLVKSVCTHLNRAFVSWARPHRVKPKVSSILYMELVAQRLKRERFLEILVLRVSVLENALIKVGD